jgi:hypothetical protein
LGAAVLRRLTPPPPDMINQTINSHDSYIVLGVSGVWVPLTAVFLSRQLFSFFFQHNDIYRYITTFLFSISPQTFIINPLHLLAQKLGVGCESPSKEPSQYFHRLIIKMCMNMCICS